MFLQANSLKSILGTLCVLILNHSSYLIAGDHHTDDPEFEKVRALVQQQMDEALSFELKEMSQASKDIAAGPRSQIEVAEIVIKGGIEDAPFVDYKDMLNEDGIFEPGLAYNFADLLPPCPYTFSKKDDLVINTEAGSASQVKGLLPEQDSSASSGSKIKGLEGLSLQDQVEVKARPSGPARVLLEVKKQASSKPKIKSLLADPAGSSKPKSKSKRRKALLN